MFNFLANSPTLVLACSIESLIAFSSFSWKFINALVAEFTAINAAILALLGLSYKNGIKYLFTCASQSLVTPSAAIANLLSLSRKNASSIGFLKSFIFMLSAVNAIPLFSDLDTFGIKI